MPTSSQREETPTRPTTVERRSDVEVTPPSLIVWTNEEAGADGSITTVTFEELDDDQTLVVMTEEFPSKEACDAAGTGAADATHETFDQLDDLLIELA